MKTLMTIFTDDTTLLIQGIKGKFDQQGKITDHLTISALAGFMTAFKDLVNLPGIDRGEGGEFIGH